MTQDLTRGPILRGLWRFSLPLMAGNVLQQTYNLVDAWVVGRWCGEAALGAVGSAFALMTLLTSIIIGLCMGAGVVVSQMWGAGDRPGMRQAAGNAFTGVAAVAAVLTMGSYALLEPLMTLMNVPPDAQLHLRPYLRVIFAGMIPSFLYNYTAAMFRAVGNSRTPILFLLASTVINIALDLLFVARLGLGASGAAWATLAAQLTSAAGCAVCFRARCGQLCPRAADLKPRRALFRRIFTVSALTSLQQSIMNFGILMVQSLVNSFGVEAMAAFAAGVKIDAFAYAPAQDFGNGFATFVAQNRGAGRHDRLQRGFRIALGMSVAFCAVISLAVYFLADPLLKLFLQEESSAALAIGRSYLRTEGLCYPGIGVLFLLYATYRGMEQAGMSVVLTVISLGLRVLLAYTLSPVFGLPAIWVSIPIGWLIADAAGLIFRQRAACAGQPRRAAPTIGRKSDGRGGTRCSSAPFGRCPARGGRAGLRGHGAQRAHRDA